MAHREPEAPGAQIGRLAQRIAGDPPASKVQESRAPRPATASPVIPPGTSGLWADVGRSFAVWRRQPLLPMSTALFGLTTAWGASSWPGASMVGLVLVGLLGWLGSERLWYLRAYSGESLTLLAAWRASFTYWGRFVRTGLCIAPLIVLLTLPVVPALNEVAESGAPAADASLPSGVIIYCAGVMLVLDFALTFVTPALVFSTTSAFAALRVGLALLRRSGRHALGYILLPPLAVLVVTQGTTEADHWSAACLLVVGSLLSLLAKGATAAYYLRVMGPALRGRRGQPL